MFEKFLSLFRRQVSSAVRDGADDGLQEADIASRVRDAVTEGVADALAGLHQLLPAAKIDTPIKAASNGKPPRRVGRLTRAVK